MTDALGAELSYTVILRSWQGILLWVFIFGYHVSRIFDQVCCFCSTAASCIVLGKGFVWNRRSWYAEVRSLGSWTDSESCKAEITVLRCLMCCLEGLDQRSIHVLSGYDARWIAWIRIAWTNLSTCFPRTNNFGPWPEFVPSNSDPLQFSIDYFPLSNTS